MKTSDIENLLDAVPEYYLKDRWPHTYHHDAVRNASGNPNISRADVARICRDKYDVAYYSVAFWGLVSHMGPFDTLAFFSGHDKMLLECLRLADKEKQRLVDILELTSDKT